MKRIFNYASLLAAAVMLVSCSGNIDPEQENNDPDNPNTENTDPTPSGPKVLKVSSDRNLIQTFDGDYATLTVTLGDEVLTEGVEFYDGDNNPIAIPGYKFATEVPGEHQIWASYGTYMSETIIIKAINTKIPVTPEDPQPSSTDFKVRALVTEFTTTGCSWCPSMKTVLHGVLENENTADMVVMTACHSSLVNSKKDPAYIKTGYEDFSGMTGMPYVFCDMYYGFGYYTTLTSSDVTEVFGELCAAKEGKAAGLAVTSSMKDGQLVIKATVKAAETGNYRIGAFLLEDGIYGQQTSATEDWMHNHDDVIRYIDSQYYTNSGKEQFYGHSVGNVDEGKTADYVFVWDLEKIWDAGALAGEQYGGCAWNPFVEENLHIAVFASTVGVDEKGNQYYYVSNVVDCPIGSDVPYEYSK
ncbi:MAG: Omp28-related outer membrane protein [Bacteroidales bacterium]|nr:Omp28-related outer membrane protein [Bacteroidales bacterium]